MSLPPLFTACSLLNLKLNRIFADNTRRLACGRVLTPLPGSCRPDFYIVIIVIGIRMITMERVLSGLLSLVWLCAAVVGFAILQRHDVTPGRPATIALGAEWPADSSISRPANRATLIVLAHPHCPCTRATITELACLMARCRDRMDAYMLFCRPLNSPAGWEK